MVVSIRWLGHASFQIKSSSENIYIDPYRTKELVKRVPDVSEEGTIILTSHGHNDHCHPSSIEELKGPDTVLVGPKVCAEKLGDELRELNPGDETKIRDVVIKAVYAYNVKRFRSPENPFHPKGEGVGFIIKVDGKTIYHAGDTDVIPEMNELEGIDVALLPCGDTYTMDNKDAVEAASIFKPNIVIPMHTWDKGVDEMAKGINNLEGVKFVALKEGEHYEL